MSVVKSSKIRSLVPLFTLILSHLHASLAFTQCYYPDGSIPTDYVWEPCTGSKYSSCCIPSEGDICQDNGLCYYPPYGQTFRGTCTDRTWNDPACPVDICVTGYETTWDWAIECSENGSSKYVCGNVLETPRNTATCDGYATQVTASYRTEIPTSSASRYVSPSPIDTALYSLYTESYTTVITAIAQTTTLTSTFESTLTSTLSQATSTSSSSGPTNAASKETPASDASKNKVTLTTGVLVAIIVGPIIAIIIAICLFFWCRRRSASKNAIKLSDQAPYPPANGPVGKDQVHPYEVDVNEATGYQKPQAYTYVAPVQENNELTGAYGTSQEKKGGQAVEMGSYEYGGLNSPQPRSPAPPTSPAPAYDHQASFAVELDGTSSLRGRNEIGER